MDWKFKANKQRFSVMCWRDPQDFKFGHSTSLFRRRREICKKKKTTNKRARKGCSTRRNHCSLLINYANFWRPRRAHRHSVTSQTQGSLTKALGDMRSIRAVDRITQTRYNWMNLVSEIVFHICGCFESREQYIDVD